MFSVHLVAILTVTILLSFSSHAREAVRGQGLPPNARGGASDKGVEIGQLETKVKNPELAKQLKELLEKCIKDVICHDNPGQCSIEVMDSECRSADAANRNADSGRGASADKTCHACGNSSNPGATPKAVDLGAIICDGQNYGPAATGDASDYYFEIALCMSGEEFNRGNCGSQARAMDESSQQAAKTRSGGVCYHHSCYTTGQNLVGRCPPQSHGDHIHFSGDGCGTGEHAPPKALAPPQAQCPRDGRTSRMNGMTPVR